MRALRRDTATQGSPGAEGSEAYYQDFSLRVGVRDWLQPNVRHEKLKRLLGTLLRGRKGLRILDLGCGAGVMSAWLSSYGRVTATDFSRPAIEFARAMAPQVAFGTQRLSALSVEGRFDLICAFDVLEHVPVSERRPLFHELPNLMAPGATVFLSTPHPRFSRWMAAERSDLMQVVEEPVEPAELLQLAAAAGLELQRYETYDVTSHPQYQVAVFCLPGGVEHGSSLDPRLRIRLALIANPLTRRLRRMRVKTRLRRSAGAADADRMLEAGRDQRSSSR